ncbi:MAG: hypothetical protein RMJ89_02165 [Flammeovirgaceae bacterium]|nr:hypothetical protein [Flammeovirgaceae bacterium]
MKKVLIFFMVFLSYTLSAQYRTIFQENDLYFSGFGGPLFSFTTIDNEFAFLKGGGGAVLINAQAIIGGYKYRSQNDINPSIKKYRQEGYQLSYEEGGFWLGWIFNPEKPVHFTANVFSGWGNVKIENVQNSFSDKIYIITPTIEMEINVTSWFRVAAGVNYRFVTGVDRIEEYKDNDFSSPGVLTSFKFGWFRTKR